MRYILTYILIMIISIQAYSQDRPTHYTDTTGNLYWRRTTPIYIFISDSPDGKKERIKSKITEKYADPMYLDVEGINYIRSRNAVDPVTMRGVPDTEVMYEIYADGIAPTSTFYYENVSKHQTTDVLYYNDGLIISLVSKDGMSGVRKLSYTINGAAFGIYQKPIPFVKQGSYEMQIFAEDNVGNVEKTKSVSFIIDSAPPYSEITINGITDDDVISTASKMYFLVYDSLSGVKNMKYRFDDEANTIYNGKTLPVSLLTEGEHVVTYFAEDNVGNIENEQSFAFYIDKSPPLMVADVLGDRFIVNDNIYFSGRTKLKLTSVDNKVGVKEVMYSIDDEEFKRYEQPFYLPSVSGVHLVKYYSVDNLNNSTADAKKSNYLGQGGFEEFKHNVNKFNVDLTGPVINHNIENYYFVREDTIYAGPYSKIKLTGSDPEAGLKQLSYTVNGKVEEIVYEKAFSLDREGYTTIDYFGYDNVNNRNIAKFSFYLDATKPDIYIQFNTGSTRIKNDVPEYPITAGIFLSATDKTSGISRLYYKLGNEPEKSYAGLITNIRKGKHTLIVRAVDFLNNETIEEIEFSIR
ncbi:MAG: hypothetical protein ACJA08_002437 [Cyclobacteriaceae bacterium]|jgi:hypothetical protein